MIDDFHLSTSVIVDGVALSRTVPVVQGDPLIPEADVRIASLATAVPGAALPAFPQGIATTNYWISTPADGPGGRRLLASVQNGVVVARDASPATNTLIRLIDKSCH